MELVGEGSVINGAYPVYFLVILKFLRNVDRSGRGGLADVDNTYFL